MNKRDLILEVLKYLNNRIYTLDSGYEWREVCGLMCQLEIDFDIKREEYDDMYFGKEREEK